jgi:uncharacterized membrane protein
VSAPRAVLMLSMCILLVVPASAYSPARATYGVDVGSDLTFPGDIQTNSGMQVTREGVPVTFILILTNKGEINDTYDIFCDGLTSGWTGQLSINNVFIPCYPYDNQYCFTVKITPPASLAGGLLSWALATVWAQSHYDPYCQTHIHLLTILNTTTNPALIKFAGPGQAARYPIRVTNTGTSSDNLSLESLYYHNEPYNIVHMPFDGHPIYWDISLTNTYFPLMPGASSNTTLKTTAPGNAVEGDYLIMNLSVKSASDPTKTDRISIITIVSIRWGVELSCDRPAKKVLGGEHAKYMINVTNTGTMRDSILLSRNDPPAGSGWSATLGALSIIMDSGDTKSIELDVLPPVDALPNDTVSINVTGVSGGDFNKHSTVETRTTANPGYLLRFNETELVQYVNPGETTTYNIQVRNVGGQQDTALLSFSGGASGWNAILNGSPMSMAPKSTGYVSLDVSAPWGAFAGDEADHQVQLLSQNDPVAPEILRTRTIVNRTKNITAELAPPVRQVDPEQAAPFTITIHNRGNAQEILRLEPGQMPSKWSMTFNESQLIVQAYSSRTITCIVTPDFTAFAGNFSFTAFARTDWTSVEVGGIVWVNRVYRFTMECADNELPVLPGGKAQYNVTITNRGNSDDSVILSLFPSDKELGWNWTAIKNIVFLNMGGADNVTVSVSAPLGAAAGIRKECRVRGTSQGNTSFWREVPLTAVVGTARALNVTGTPDHLDRAPGAPADFTIGVRNIGNIAEDVSLSSNPALAGWTIAFKSTGGASLNSFRLPPTEVQGVIFGVTPPPGTLAGNYTFYVNVTTAGGLRYGLSFRVNVLPFFSFDIIPEKDYIILPAGMSMNLKVRVRNLGNVADDILLSVCGTMGERWASVMHPLQNIGANSSWDYSLILRAPADSRNGMHYFDVRGRSSTGEEKNVTIRVRITEKGATTTIDSPCNILILLIVASGVVAGLMAYRAKRRAADAERDKGSRALGVHRGEAEKRPPPTAAWRVRHRPLPDAAPPVDVEDVGQEYDENGR